MVSITRQEALWLCRFRRVYVRTSTSGFPTLQPFTPESPFFLACGPYNFSNLRYFMEETSSSPLAKRNGKGRASERLSAGETGEAGVEEGDAGPATQEDEPIPALSGKFMETEVRCGDTVALELLGQNLPGGAQAKAEVKAMEGDKVLETLSAPMPGASVKLNWISRKPGAAWGKPEVHFSAEAGGAKAKSGNQVRFKECPDQAEETKTIPCTSGIFGWTGKFAIKKEGGTLRITTKVKLVNRLGAKPAASDPLPAVGPPVSDEDKKSMQADIESKLSGKWILHRKDCRRGAKCDCDKDRGCCKFQVKVGIEFVESGEHHVVNLFQGAGRANAANWTRVKTRENSWAHEAGHLLAWYDEYEGGAVGQAPRWKAPNAGMVMASGLGVPFEYYWDFRDWMKSKAGESWEGIA